MTAGPSTSRTEGFSDGVFAIAITLLILELKVPTADEVARWGLAGSLVHHWLPMLLFVITFATIGVIWLNHHEAFTHLAAMDRTLQLANLALLAAVAFLPFPHAVLGQATRAGLFSRQLSEALAFYGLAFVVATAPWVVIWRHARAHPEVLRADSSRAEAARNVRRSVAGMAIYAVMAGLGLLLPLAAIIGFAALALFFAISASGAETTPGTPSPGH